MSLTAKDVKEIMSLLEASSFDHLSLEIDGVKLTLDRGGAGASEKPAKKTRAAKAAKAADLAQTSAAPAKARKNTDPGLLEVKSPLLGVYYRAPKPGEPAFVDVGSKVTEDTVIGIVEVMKLMNSVRAGVKGEVVEILAENGALIEHGEVVLLVRPEA